MMFINIDIQRKCLVFTREDDDGKKLPKKHFYPKNMVKTGKIMVKMTDDHLNKDGIQKGKAIDLKLRYEHVHDQLKNCFAGFNDACNPKDLFLYVCGYLDNKIRIFNFRDNKGHVFTVHANQARVTCMRFSQGNQFLYTCDADGVIHHYQRSCHKGKDAEINFDATPSNTNTTVQTER